MLRAIAKLMKIIFMLMFAVAKVAGVAPLLKIQFSVDPTLESILNARVRQMMGVYVYPAADRHK